MPSNLQAACWPILWPSLHHATFPVHWGEFWNSDYNHLKSNPVFSTHKAAALLSWRWFSVKLFDQGLHTSANMTVCVMYRIYLETLVTGSTCLWDVGTPKSISSFLEYFCYKVWGHLNMSFPRGRQVFFSTLSSKTSCDNSDLLC